MFRLRDFFSIQFDSVNTSLFQPLFQVPTLLVDEISSSLMTEACAAKTTADAAAGIASGISSGTFDVNASTSSAINAASLTLAPPPPPPPPLAPPLVNPPPEATVSTTTADDVG